MRRWDSLIDKYLHECSTRGLAESTIEGRRSEYGKWGLFLKRCRPRVNLEEIPWEYHIKYIKKRSRFHSKQTVYSVISHMRILGDFFVKEGMWNRNNIRWIRGPRLDIRGRSPKRISRGHLQKLLEATPSCSGVFNQATMTAIIVLMYSTGLRRGELQRLDISQYDRSAKTLKLDGRKTGRERILPLPEVTVQCLESYLSFRHNKLEETGNLEETALFVNSYGRRKQSQAIGKTLQMLARKAGIPPVVPHQFRHTFASDLIAEGENLVKVQRLLGHSSVSSTMRYVHVSSPERMEAVERLPLEGIIKRNRGENS